MALDWDGVFSNPIYKHRLYTGKIENHLKIKSVEPLDDIDEDDFEDEYEYLTELGRGGRRWLVTVAFIPSLQEDAYEYVVNEEEASGEEKSHMMSEELFSEMEVTVIVDGFTRRLKLSELADLDVDLSEIDIPDADKVLGLIGDDLRG